MLALSHALILIPTLLPNVQWLGPVVTRFATDRNEVWLTIDDGPTEDTHAVLDLLDRYGVKVTFFVKGMLVAAQPAIAREILARGHSIGNHTQTHPAGSYWCAFPGRIADEIDACTRVLAETTGRETKWFRAPVGMKNPAVHPALAKRGMRLIGWTARGFDAFVADPDVILARILSRLTPGAIVVLHQGRQHSLRVLERVIVAIQERGYSFVIPDDGRLKTSR